MIPERIKQTISECFWGFDRIDYKGSLDQQITTVIFEIDMKDDISFEGLKASLDKAFKQNSTFCILEDDLTKVQTSLKKIEEFKTYYEMEYQLRHGKKI